MEALLILKPPLALLILLSVSALYIASLILISVHCISFYNYYRNLIPYRLYDFLPRLMQTQPFLILIFLITL
uniref:Uncharacterized protein n=1 Tax=Octopus bimaculoides TaxID=37653 RepID=A0A0L8HJ77_OCTBM